MTTLAAFLPLFMISDVIGQIVRAIPIVIVAVLIASLIECFLVLPGHLRDVTSNFPIQKALTFTESDEFPGTKDPSGTWTIVMEKGVLSSSVAWVTPSQIVVMNETTLWGR